MQHILYTGQDQCYDTRGEPVPCAGSGQDGEYRRGQAWPADRFLLHGEVVIDQLTGLGWTRRANFSGFPSTWTEAFAAVATMNQEQYGGFADWRLPNRNELRSLLSYQAKKPALPAGHPFTEVFLGWYWSSTTAAINPAYAWAVHLEGARLFYGGKDQAYLFWPVRGTGNGLLPATGQQHCFDVAGRQIECGVSCQDGALRLGTAWPKPRFMVEGELVCDRLTGLYWPRHAALTGETVTWEKGLAAVRAWAGTAAGEQCIWRLPTINELASLVDCSRHSPALPADHPFTGLQHGYWASTTSFFETDWAWVLYLDKGACGVGFKPDATFSVWPVGFSLPNNP